MRQVALHGRHLVDEACVEEAEIALFEVEDVTAGRQGPRSFLPTGETRYNYPFGLLRQKLMRASRPIR